MKHSLIDTLTPLLLIVLCSVPRICPAQGLPCTLDQADGLCDDLEYSDKDGKYHYFYTSPVITIGHAAQTLRFTVTETTSGDSGGGYPCFAIAEFYLYDANGKEISLKASDFSTNAQEETEGPMEYICDGNYGTYFHSLWSQYDDSTGEHYIEIQLPHSLESFAFGYVSRYEAVAPASITISDPTWKEPEPEDPSVYDYLTMYAEETAPGEEWIVTFAFDTEVDYTAFQMDLTLPDAFTAYTDIRFLLADGRASDTHVLTSSVLRGGTRRVVVYASNVAPFASREGDLFYMLMTAKATVPQGTYTITASNIRFSTIKGKEKKHDNLTTTLNVTEDGVLPISADANVPIYWNCNGIRSTEHHGIQISKGQKRLIK